MKPTNCAHRVAPGLSCTVPAAQAQTEKVLYSFCSQQNCTDGEVPEAGLINVYGTLYGTTAGGGTYGYGTVFSLDLETGAETVLWSFGSGTDGTYPVGGLITIKHTHTLYGTTDDGGGVTNCPYYYGCGTVFSLDLKTGVETVLHAFGSGSDGVWPLAGLTNVKGTLYGTTDNGGTDYEGTVFSVDPTTGAEAVVWSFDGLYCKSMVPGPAFTTETARHAVGRRLLL
ncbi:MAG TPA: choice-of-anchor tandem repeat GloVer-containing protein [Rhizomicrobium sp.]|jgi:uncharacterized repeat protein (TIGR03803 family)|nr:choice-of-anchor tandem repeat GloVer-containing protein [Rhizomicrobium sp.]